MEMYRIAAAALDAVGLREHYVERVVNLVGSKFEELCNFKVFSRFFKWDTALARFCAVTHLRSSTQLLQTVAVKTLRVHS